MPEIPTIRTIDNAFREIKSKDENSPITKAALRELAASGKVKTVQIKRRLFINMSSLCDFLSGSEAASMDRSIDSNSTHKANSLTMNIRSQL